MTPKFHFYFIIFSLFFSSLLLAQPEPIPYHFEDAAIHSGSHKGKKLAKKNTIEYNSKIRKDEAVWLRLMFSKVELSSNSYILITSLKDGAQQKLDARSIKEWNNTSAFFNGNELSIELHVAAQDSGVYFNVEKIMVGEPNAIQDVSEICGTEDNRTASSHDAVGRIVPSGCTGWIPAAGVLVTAGHCAISSSEVIEFNVPSSLSTGTIQHPAPSNQYTINQGSWNFTDGGPGNDWATFTVYNNSVTGLQPIQAQDEYFLLEQSLTPSTIRVTGYGLDGPAPNFGGQGGAKNSDNQTQQTHSGSNSGSSGNTLRYRVDTQSANSGSPVINESNQKAIGVHTHGGCTVSGGNNNGTSTYHTNFWNSISFNINLSSAQYMETGSGASYKVNGASAGGSFSGRGGIIEAVPPPNYNFFNWSDGNTSNQRAVTANFSGYALFKGIHKSNNTSAFSNSSQRKLVKTKDNWMHQVYESNGRVWLEHSTNNGSTWFIGNNGQPLDNGEGKCPSMDWHYNTADPNNANYNAIVVVYQESYSSTYNIQYAVFKYTSGSYVRQSQTSYGALYTEPAGGDQYAAVNANPNIAWGVYYRFALTFERKSTVGSMQPGIYWRAGALYESGLEPVPAYPTPAVKITGTSVSSINAAVSLNKVIADDSYFDVVYQTASSAPASITDVMLFLPLQWKCLGDVAGYFL